MKYFQFHFTAPGQSLKVFIAAPNMATARIVARDARPGGYALSDLLSAMETSRLDEGAGGHFLTSSGWVEL